MTRTVQRGGSASVFIQSRPLLLSQSGSSCLHHSAVRQQHLFLWPSSPPSSNKPGQSPWGLGDREDGISDGFYSSDGEVKTAPG